VQIVRFVEVFLDLFSSEQVRVFEFCSLVGCYRCSLRDSSEQRSSHLLRDGRLKSRRLRFLFRPREVSVSDIIYGVYRLLHDVLRGVESISKGIITNSSQNLERKVF
jgi:hypothetical protein